MSDFLDISSDGAHPANVLSNFAENSFVFEQVYYKSMESFLQSLKFPKYTDRREIAKLGPHEAKKRGAMQDNVWKANQVLYFEADQPMKRDSVAYQYLLSSVYLNLFWNSRDFREALRASGQAQLVHSIGNTDPSDTVLTVGEFCSRLTQLRSDLF